jgi:YkoY family integral membrane protein
MLGQTFALTDLPSLFALILIEVLLSADNAIILAAIVHPLPIVLRKKALLIGAGSAFILRAIAIISVSFILKAPWLQLFGAAYLLYLCIHHFAAKAYQPKTPKKKLRSFWKTVIVIELMDFSFALDSIIAGVAFIVTQPSGDPETFFHPKLWIVYIGGIIGLLVIRYAASLFIKLIDRYPLLSTSAYLLVGLVGIKLTVAFLMPHIPYFKVAFWLGFILIVLSGFRKKLPT